MSVVNERLAVLRQEMAKVGADYYIIPSQDAHQSEYVAGYWRARAYFSGFTGSAGTLIVTKDEACVWADGRYHIQVVKETEGTDVTPVKMGLPGVPSPNEWLKEHVKEGETVAYDGRTFSTKGSKELEKLLPQARILFAEDLAGKAWPDRPALPAGPVFELGTEFTGESRTDKLARIRLHMTEQKADYLMLASLDDIAWTLNLRGRDILYTPVFYSYLLIGQDKAWLCIDDRKLNDAIRADLERDGVDIGSYDRLPELLGTLPAGKILLDEARINKLLSGSIPESWTVQSETDITTVYKACKNETEQKNFRVAHEKDGAAMVRFIKWLKETVKDPAAKLDEYSVGEKLKEIRLSCDSCFDLSFGTIAGYGPNGSIIHYSAKKETAAALKPEGMIVVDSGGQYYEGTTDITRTIALGPVTDRMRFIYTLVLKGHLQLANAVFMEGTEGHYLDILAREPLWKHGMDFRHGTGHGVGSALAVHEGPQNIGLRKDVPVALEPGMVTSDEPGYYPEGEFGVRIENLILTKEACRTSDGRFLKFENLTLCPYEPDLIDVSLLTAEEKDWLDAYNKRIRETLSPYLTEEEREWLAAETGR